MDANSNVNEQQRAVTIESNEVKKQINQLEKELPRKKAASSNGCVTGAKKKSKCDLEGNLGRMIPYSVRGQAVQLICEAVISGAARFKACAELEISVRTYQRLIVDGDIKTDGRSNA